MKALSAMPPLELALPLQIVGVAAAAAAALGIRARLALPIAWLAALFLRGMHTSIGKVMHNDIPLLLAVCPILFAPSADAVGLQARPPTGATKSWRYGWSLRLATILVAGGYFFAGVAKLTRSEFAWVTTDNLRWVLYFSSDSQPTPNNLALFIAGHPALAHAIAAATLLIEVGFPLVLIWRLAAWFFVPGAICLHLGIALAMGLDYSPWMATLVVLFVDWPAVLDRTRSIRRPSPRPGNAWHVPPYRRGWKALSLKLFLSAPTKPW